MDLTIDPLDLKACVHSRCEILSQIPNILQSLEKGKFIDSLKDCLQGLCDKEYSYLQSELAETMCPKQNNNIYLKAIKDNFDVYKANLKKGLKIMVEDVYTTRTRQALQDYQQPVKKMPSVQNGQP
jgi:hypothetical protein